MNRSFAVLLIAIPAQVARGGEIYKANCAACHGANAEGAPNWSQKGPDGKFPPPLDAIGHGWHHPKSALVQTIKDGTIKLGGGMPAWKDKLSLRPCSRRPDRRRFSLPFRSRRIKFRHR